MPLLVFAKAVVATMLSQITPIAIQNTEWKHYALFIATNFAAAFMYFFFLPETKGKSPKKIAELFGDALATEQLGHINAAGRSRALFRRVSMLKKKNSLRGLASAASSCLTNLLIEFSYFKICIISKR